jgi:hypothetical protein
MKTIEVVDWGFCGKELTTLGMAPLCIILEV